MNELNDIYILESLCDAIAGQVVKEYFHNLKKLKALEYEIKQNEMYFRSEDFEMLGYDGEYIINRVKQLADQEGVSVKYGTV